MTAWSGTYYLNLEGRVICPEDGGNMFLPNVGTPLPDRAMS
jgi:hypothetical protein